MAGMVIGDNCYIWNVTMSAGDPIVIGNECVLTGCTILGHDASPALFIPELKGEPPFNRRSLFRKTTIHDRSFIGVGAIVLCGRSVGPDCVVAAGAVVYQGCAAQYGRCWKSSKSGRDNRGVRRETSSTRELYLNGMSVVTK